MLVELQTATAYLVSVSQTNVLFRGVNVVVAMIEVVDVAVSLLVVVVVVALTSKVVADVVVVVVEVIGIVDVVVDNVV